MAGNEYLRIFKREEATFEFFIKLLLFIGSVLHVLLLVAFFKYIYSLFPHFSMIGLIQNLFVCVCVCVRVCVCVDSFLIVSYVLPIYVCTTTESL